MQRLMNKRGLGILLALLALLLAVAGCSSSEEAAPTPARIPTSLPALPTISVSAPSIPIPTPTPAAQSQGAAGEEAESEVLLGALAQSRIIVHTASMSVEVDNVARTIDGITAVATDLHGWVVNSDRSSRHSGSIAIRVPAGSLEEALRRVDAMALKTVSRAVTSEDVTDEYVDTQSRLVSLRATEQRVRSFLDRAQNVEEALLVQEELADLQLRIEEAQGRLNYLGQVAAFSLLEVSLRLTPTIIGVNAGPDSSVRVGQTERFRAFFIAPPGIDDFSFIWDFGDGTVIRGSGSAPMADGQRVTATVNHVYNDDLDSPYIATVKLTGAGEGGIAEGSDSLLVEVRQVPTIEVFAGDDRTVEEGNKVLYSASFTRPDELWDYEYSWDFGDGSPTLQGEPEEGASRIEITRAFDNFRPAAYPVVLTVNATSEVGRVSASDSFSVRVTESESLVVGDWNIGGTVKEAVRTLSIITRGVTTTLIWLVILGGPLLVVVAIIYFFGRRNNTVGDAVRGACRSLWNGVKKALSSNRTLQQ